MNNIQCPVSIGVPYQLTPLVVSVSNRQLVGQLRELDGAKILLGVRCIHLVRYSARHNKASITPVRIGLSTRVLDKSYLAGAEDQHIRLAQLR